MIPETNTQQLFASRRHTQLLSVFLHGSVPWHAWSAHHFASRERLSTTAQLQQVLQADIDGGEANASPLPLSSALFSSPSMANFSAEMS